MTRIPPIPRRHSSARIAMVLPLVSIGTVAIVLIASCNAAPKNVALSPVEVERQWRRTVGEPKLELPPPRTGISDAGLVMSFRPVATVEQVDISRAFVVYSEATVTRAGRNEESPVDLESLAAAELGHRYPELASNAEAAIESTDATLQDVVVEVNGRPSFGDLRMSIEPKPPVFGSAKPTRVPASDVAVVAARLVDRRDPRRVLVQGRLLETAQSGEQRIAVPIESLDSADCRKLRSLLIGDYAIEADCEIRTGARSVVVETRTFPATAEREWRDPVRRAARERLAALATTATDSALAVEAIGTPNVVTRGGPLPGVSVTNRAPDPVLDLRAFSVAYQIAGPDGLRFVGSGSADGEPCLCPGDSIEIATTEFLPACGESVGGSDDRFGLVLLVSSSGLERRSLGPVPVVAVDASGAQLSPPRISSVGMAFEATSAVDAHDLQLRLSIEGEGEIVVPFPAIAAGGRASVVLPDALGPGGAAVWEGWRGSGRRVEVELLEATLWGCEGAQPARQAFRMSG